MILHIRELERCKNHAHIDVQKRISTTPPIVMKKLHTIDFQMVMFTLSKTADSLKLTTPRGILIIYLGFGAGLAVFMFSGFVKSIPVEIEEAADVDGAGPLRTFFGIVLPIMKPTFISVAILETMWIWNDYLLPYLILVMDYTDNCNVTLGHNLFCIIQTVYTREKTQEKKRLCSIMYTAVF